MNALTPAPFRRLLGAANACLGHLSGLRCLYEIQPVRCPTCGPSSLVQAFAPGSFNASDQTSYYGGVLTTEQERFRHATRLLTEALAAFGAKAARDAGPLVSRAIASRRRILALKAERQMFASLLVWRGQLEPWSCLHSIASLKSLGALNNRLRWRTGLPSARSNDQITWQSNAPATQARQVGG